MNTATVGSSFDPGSTASHLEAVASLLAVPPPGTHAVQFYEQDEFLYDMVAKFLGAGLQAGDRLLVIASATHRHGFESRLDATTLQSAVESGQLKMLDAEETLSQFMVGDMPDPDLFRELLADLLATVQQGYPAARVRAYGEMVDALWRRGNSRAALRLEELWNEAGKVHSFSLLCAYAMGNFEKAGDTSGFSDVCGTHSHVVPTESFAIAGDTHTLLREISLLQQRACALENQIEHRKVLEQALRDALQHRNRVEKELRRSVKREREARTRAEANDAFKQVFLGMLGHDLRNPLSTILTTARLMTIRGELAAESHKRLQRILSSGERMQRMIEQILDVTRAKLSSGIPVTPSPEPDLVPRVLRIVDEIRTAHPGRSILFHSEPPCAGLVDGDRFEQVVSNLLGNAVAHGDPQQPISVTVAQCDGQNLVTIAVHNYGPPIDPTFMPLLFDPFRRGGNPQGHSEGLGLGLYISKCIVDAHGGRIHVESSQPAGTRFEAVFPRA